MRRRAHAPYLARGLVVLATVLLSALLGTGAAVADDTLPPPLTPPGVTPPPVVEDNQVPPGPTYVVTPGPEGADLGPPADQSQIDDVTVTAPDPSESATTSGGKPASARTTVAPPAAPVPAVSTGQQAAAPPAPLPSQWVVGAGTLLALVLLELGRAATARPLRRQGGPSA